MENTKQPTRDFESDVRKLKDEFVPDHAANIANIANTLYARLVEHRIEKPLEKTRAFPSMLLFRMTVVDSTHTVCTDYSDKDNAEKIAAKINEQAAGGVKCAAAGFFSVFGYDLPFGNRRIQCEFTH